MKVGNALCANSFVLCFLFLFYRCLLKRMFSLEMLEDHSRTCVFPVLRVSLCSEILIKRIDILDAKFVLVIYEQYKIVPQGS